MVQRCGGLVSCGGLDAGHSEGLVARISSINGGFNGNIWPFWLKWFKTRDCLANLCVLRWQETSMWNCSVAKFTPWQCGLTIEELKEEVKAFNPSEDEITRILSTVEFVLHGEKLNDLQMTVSDSIIDSANVQVIFYVKPANECVNKFGHRVTELRDVRIPSTETSIQEDAFEGCACLLRLVIPESVTWIGDHAGCSSLTSLTIPGFVTQIGDGAFRACSSLTSLTIPKSVTQIRYKAFSGCSSLTSLTIPESVTQIGDGAFRYCTSLTSLTIPKSVTQIGDHAFTGCSSLKSLTIPESVTQIGMYFFSLHLFDEFDHPRVCDSDFIQSFFWLQLFDKFGRQAETGRRGPLLSF